MATGNSIFKDLEPSGEVPEYLKHALVAEVDTIRNSMQIVTHFTENLLSTIVACLSTFTDDETND